MFVTDNIHLPADAVALDDDVVHLRIRGGELKAAGLELGCHPISVANALMSAMGGKRTLALFVLRTREISPGTSHELAYNMAKKNFAADYGEDNCDYS